MLLAIQQNDKNPNAMATVFSQSNKSPAKKSGMNKKRFLAQSLGLNSLI